MAQEMEHMFAESNEEVSWDSPKNHVQCYAHNVKLVVKHGLNSIELDAGHIKSTTPPNTLMSIPSIVFNKEMSEVVRSEK